MKRIAGELKSSKGFLALDLLFDSRGKGAKGSRGKGKASPASRADPAPKPSNESTQLVTRCTNSGPFTPIPLCPFIPQPLVPKAARVVVGSISKNAHRLPTATAISKVVYGVLTP